MTGLDLDGDARARGDVERVRHEGADAGAGRQAERVQVGRAAELPAHDPRGAGGVGREHDLVRPQHDLDLAGRLGRRLEPADLGGDDAAGLASGHEVGLAEQRRDEAGRRPVEGVGGLADVLEASLAHDAHPLADGEGLALVVGDEHARGAGAAQGGGRRVAHGRAQPVVEVAERLVEQHDRRPRGQRAGEGHPLLLPAGQLVGVAATVVGQVDELEQLGDARGAVTPARHPEGDVVGDPQVGEQRRVLEDDPDAAVLRGHPRAAARDDPAADEHLPGVGLEQARGEHQQRRLAAAAGADERDELAVGDRQRDVVDGGRAPVPLGDAPQLERRHRPAPAGTTTSAASRASTAWGPGASSRSPRKSSTTGIIAATTMARAGSPAIS